MKKTRYVAGIMSALLLASTPGVLQTAFAAQALANPDTGVVQLVSSSTTKSYSVTVTADSLNVRAKNSKDSKITGTLKKGAVVTIVEEKNGWGKLENGKGWISLKYTKKTSDKDADKTKDNSSVSKYQVKVTSDGLNIRDKASVKGKIKGTLKKGAVVTIVEEKNGWGKLENGKGWISLKYTKKTSDKDTDKTKDNSSVSKYQVKVTSDGLNIRDKAGISGKVKGTLKKGAVVTIVEEKNGWGKLENGKGWISLKYTKKTSDKDADKAKDNSSVSKYQVKVTSDGLNIRDKASVKGKVKGTLKKGEVVTIVEEKNGWGKLENGKGWISLKYTKKT